MRKLLYIFFVILLTTSSPGIFAQVTIQLSNQSVFENAGANASIGLISTSDGLNQYTFSIVDGDGRSGNDVFSIVLGASGAELVAKNSFNFETMNSYSVRIRAQGVVGPNSKIDGINNDGRDDPAPPPPPASFEQDFTITVMNVWEAPTDIMLTDQAVPENAGVNGVVGFLTSTDPDVGQPHSYSLVEGDGATNNGLFDIINDNGTWNLVAKESFDFETDPKTYSVRVRSTDITPEGADFKLDDINAEPPSYEKQFTISVTDANDDPLDLVLTGDDVDENEPADTFVGQFLTVDPDAGSSHTYSLVEGTGDEDNGLFYFIGNSLLTLGPINHEDSATRNIRVKTDDGEGGTRVEQFVINILDINDAPTGPSLQGNSVAENSDIGTTVGTFSPEDEDDGDTHTYELVNVQNAKASVTNNGGPGDGFNMFSIDDTSLKTAAVFNFEGAYQSYSITVKVTDGGNPGLTSMKSFTISINDVNEAPTGINLNDAVIAENAGANGIVGALSTTGDPDNGQSHIYSLVGGTGSDDNSMFDISGSNLVAKNSLDFESRSPATYKVRIKTTDQPLPPGAKLNKANVSDAKSFEKEFVVTVTDVNDAPTAVLLSNNRIPENSATGLTIGTFSTTDDEAPAQSYTYTLEDPVSAKPSITNTPAPYVDPNFEIVGNAIKNKVAFNFESQNMYTVYVRTTDNGNPNKWYTQMLYIYIDNVNEKPVLAIGNDPVTYVEKSPGVQLVGQAEVSDLDQIQAGSNKLSVSDGQSLLISKATVQITGNYHSGYDELIYGPLGSNASKNPLPVVNNGFTPSWDAQTGTLTFTGEQSLEAYELALRSVSFKSSSTSPDPQPRTVTFILTDVPVPGERGADLNKSGLFNQVNVDYGLTSDPVARIVNITLVNDAPMLSAVEQTSVSYTEGDGEVQISNTITVNDDNSYTTLFGATVTIGTGYVEGEDFLRYETTNSITGQFNGPAGVLTLSGSRSLADYQAALRMVKFENTSEDPTEGDRTITFVVDDPGGHDTKTGLSVINIQSQGVSRMVNVSGDNDSPTLSAIQAGQLEYWENSGAQQLINTITIADVDDGNIYGATIQITGNYEAGADVLTFVVPDGPKLSQTQDVQINSSWNDATGTLTLEGQASIQSYQGLLTLVRFENNSDNPSTDVRTVTFKVNDRSTAKGDIKQKDREVYLESNGQTREIVIYTNDDMPMLSQIEAAALTYLEDNTGTQITNTIVVSDVDSDNLYEAVVVISQNYQPSEDMLGFTDQNGITGQWDANQGILWLTGTASLAVYQTALRSVTYYNTSNSPSILTRTVSFYPYGMRKLPDVKSEEEIKSVDFDPGSEMRDIDIVPSNDDPIVEINTGFSVDAGGSAVITNTQLLSTDIDFNQYLIYTVLQAPAHGMLKNGTTEIPEAGTFFQSDINDGKISYTHSGDGSTSDAFLFEVADNNNGTAKFEAVSITVITAGAAPMPPTNIVIEVNEIGQPVLSWTNGAGEVDGIQVIRFTGLENPKYGTINNFEIIATLPPGTDSFVDETAVEGVSYKYQLIAFNANGSSGTIDEQGGGDGPALPAQLTSPSSLSAAVNENGSVSLSWNDNSNLEDGYKIERSSGTPSSFTEIGMVDPGVTSFTDEQVSDGVTYSYRVKAFNATLESGYSNIADATSIITGIEDWISDVPTSYDLQQNYPNPFNPTTTIRFGLPGESNVTIKIFNILGQEMASLVNRVMSGGYHEVVFDASELTSGLYIYKIEAGDFVQIKKMMLMK